MTETPKRRGRRPNVEVEAERRRLASKPAGVLTLVLLETGEVETVKLTGADLLAISRVMRAARVEA